MLRLVCLASLTLLVAMPTALGDDDPDTDCIYISTLPDPSLSVQCIPVLIPGGHSAVSTDDPKAGGPGDAFDLMAQ